MRRLFFSSILLVAAGGCKGRTEVMFGFATTEGQGEIDHVDFKVFDAQSQVIEVSRLGSRDVPAGLYELPDVRRLHRRAPSRRCRSTSSARSAGRRS